MKYPVSTIRVKSQPGQGYPVSTHMFFINSRGSLQEFVSEAFYFTSFEQIPVKVK